MKKKNLVLIAVILLAVTSCQEKVDIEKEKEAIKAVIEDVSNAYLARDFDKQSEFFLQDESIMLQYSGEGSSGIGFGWEDVSTGYKNFYKIKSTPETRKCKLENYKIKVYQESAWATYDEMWYTSEGAYIWKNTNVKFFEKLEGEWKIVFLSSIINAPSDEPLVEGEAKSETEDSE